MKLSQETIAILKNFATINPNLVFKPGNKIETISEMKNMLASAQISEDIPLEFGIYDLNSFLSVVTIFDEPELVFDGNKKVRIADADGKTSFNYFFAEPSNLTAPTKSLELPSVDASFALSDKDISSLRRAAGTLKCKDLVFEGNVAKLCDLKDSTANTFELELDVAEIPEGAKIIFNIDYLKLLPGGYGVTVSNKMIAKFVNATLPGNEYYVAVERNSKF